MRQWYCGDGISRGSRRSFVFMYVNKDAMKCGEYVLAISTDVADGGILLGGCDCAFLGEVEGCWRGTRGGDDG